MAALVHRDADGLPGAGAAQGDLLPADHDHAGGAGAALHPDGLGCSLLRPRLPAAGTPTMTAC